jgi:hypothetical protein
VIEPFVSTVEALALQETARLAGAGADTSTDEAQLKGPIRTCPSEDVTEDTEADLVPVVLYTIVVDRSLPDKPSSPLQPIVYGARPFETAAVHVTVLPVVADAGLALQPSKDNPSAYAKVPGIIKSPNIAMKMLEINLFIILISRNNKSTFYRTYLVLYT